jgi:hypothetical protein
MNRQVQTYKLKDFVLQAKEKFSALLLIVFLIVSLFLCFYFLDYIISTSYRKVYKGKVVDKWLSITETQQGSIVTRRLLIEGGNGERFKMFINIEEYDKIKIGDFVENKGNGEVVVLNE